MRHDNQRIPVNGYTGSFVRIENKSLDELGTRGILAPVMFWSPKDPDWKP